MYTHERTLSSTGRRTRVGRVGIAVAAVSMLGLGAFAVPALAADAPAPTIKLTAVDTDIIAVSGKNFPASSKVNVKATTPTGEGKGDIDANAEGRILLGFQVPAGFKGKIDVTASTGTEVKASIDVDVPAATTTTPAATTTPTTGTTEGQLKAPDSVKNIQGADSLSSVLNTYNTKAAAYNKSREGFADRIDTSGNADLSNKLMTFNNKLFENNTKVLELNNSLNALNTTATRPGVQITEVQTALDKSTKLANEAVGTIDATQQAFDALKPLLPAPAATTTV